MQTPLPLAGSPMLGLYSPAVIAPGPGARQLETAPMPQIQQKLFTLASPKPAHPVFPVSSLGNLDEALACASPWLLCHLPDAAASLWGPEGHSVTLLLGTE